MSNANREWLYLRLHGWLSDNCDYHYAMHRNEGYLEVCPFLLCRLCVWIGYHLMPDWWFEP